jgi:hypothetical protein
LLPSFADAYRLFLVLTLAVAGLLALRLGWRIGGRRSAILAFCIMHFALLLVLPVAFLYAWDFPDLIIFYVFIDFALASKPWPWFAGLFAVAIFNRESALVIPLWMALDPLARWTIERRNRALTAADRHMIAAGLICAVTGIGVVLSLRSLLLVQAGNPQVGNLMFQLVNNLHTIIDRFSAFGGGIDADLRVVQIVGVLCFIAIVGLLALRVAWTKPRRWLGLSLSHLALLGGLLLFGLVQETRIWIELIPFIVAAGVTLVMPILTQSACALSGRASG